MTSDLAQKSLKNWFLDKESRRTLNRKTFDSDFNIVLFSFIRLIKHNDITALIDSSIVFTHLYLQNIKEYKILKNMLQPNIQL